MEDVEIARAARRSFEKRGIEIHTGARITSLVHQDDGVRVEIQSDSGESVSADFDRAVLAVGITGNAEGLGLEGTGVRVERGHVVVNEWLETGEPGVHAIGDVAGPPWLAHMASHEGVLCVERIAGVEGTHPLDRTRVPGCTYCRPQVASVGLTEAAAREGGREVRVGRFPLTANGKALALAPSDGSLMLDHSFYDLQLAAFCSHVRQVQSGWVRDTTAFENTGEEPVRQMELIDAVYRAAGLQPRTGPAKIKAKM